MQAIILAGGFGTRLQSEVRDVPKPMAPVAGRPFLAWLLEYMQAQGVTEAALCLHHQPDVIRDYFGDSFGSMRLRYLIEERPLGTGGAIRHALAHLQPTEPLLALNGDSLVEVNYKNMLALHAREGRLMTLATRHVPDCSRASRLTVRDGKVIVRYETVGDARPGVISTGFYALSPRLFDDYHFPPAFSFERDFLAPYTPTLLPTACDAVEYFLDIGVPADYRRAQMEIPERLGVMEAA